MKLDNNLSIRNWVVWQKIEIDTQTRAAKFLKTCVFLKILRLPFIQLLHSEVTAARNKIWTSHESRRKVKNLLVCTYSLIVPAQLKYEPHSMTEWQGENNSTKIWTGYQIAAPLYCKINLFSCYFRKACVRKSQGKPTSGWCAVCYLYYYIFHCTVIDILDYMVGFFTLTLDNPEEPWDSSRAGATAHSI